MSVNIWRSGPDICFLICGATMIKSWYIFFCHSGHSGYRGYKNSNPILVFHVRFCLDLFIFIVFYHKDWPGKKVTIYFPIFYFLFCKKFRKYLILLSAFCLIIWLMKSPNSFEKIAILKIWQLFFILCVKTYFGILPLKWCIFRNGKNWFSQIFPCNSYWSH